jgi:hypothetical protein
LLKIGAFNAKHIAAGRPDECVTRSVPPLAGIVGREAQLTLRLSGEPGPGVEPQQRVRSSDLSAGDHDTAGIAGCDRPEGLVVVPAAVLLGIHRVVDHAIACTQSDEDRAVSIGEGDGPDFGSYALNTLDGA